LIFKNDSKKGKDRYCWKSCVNGARVSEKVLKAPDEFRELVIEISHAELAN
jgi:hypothetical protein